MPKPIDGDSIRPALDCPADVALDALMCARFQACRNWSPAIRDQLEDACDMLQDEACELGAYQWGYVDALRDSE